MSRSLEFLDVVTPEMALYMNSSTPDASSTMTRMLPEWKPWNRSSVLVENP